MKRWSTKSKSQSYQYAEDKFIVKTRSMQAAYGGKQPNYKVVLKLGTKRKKDVS